MTKVVNCNHTPYDILIDRTTPWGNPFIIGKDGTREEVIEKYRKWIKGKKSLLISLYQLKDKTLGCHCKPEACHGDVLIELIEK